MVEERPAPVTGSISPNVPPIFLWAIPPVLLALCLGALFSAIAGSAQPNSDDGPSPLFGWLLVILASLPFAAKVAHLGILSLDQRFPELPVPFSVLPALAAIALAFGVLLLSSLGYIFSSIIVERIMEPAKILQ